MEQSLDYVLYELAYVNLMLYTSSLPTYHKPDKDKIGKDYGEKINADDPNNNDILRKIIDES